MKIKNKQIKSPKLKENTKHKSYNRDETKNTLTSNVQCEKLQRLKIKDEYQRK